jgi:predicted peptidase
MKTFFFFSKTTFSILVGMFITLTIIGKPCDNTPNLEMKIFNEMYKGEFDLIVPENKKNKKLPVYIILPGGVVKDKKYENFKKEFIIPGVEKAEGIIFSPKISWKRPETAALEKIVIDFIMAAKNSYHIDDKKIVLIGYSNGAMQSIKLTENNDHLFSVLIVIASNFNFLNKIKTPIYIIHGTNDRYFSINQASENVSIARGLGCNITFVVAEGKNDFGAAQYVCELNDSIIEIENSIWSQRVE